MRKQLFVSLLLALAVPCASFSAFAAPEPQQQGQAATIIRGTVFDENNEPLIGVSVVQKGVKTNAVSTDVEGNFAIRVKPGTILQFSYVGYAALEMKAAQGMDVYMQPTTEMLNELVAIGYGSQKRANLTGAVTTVDVARVMENRPEQDVLKALQGAVPGLTVMNSTGNINGTPSIKIRGTGTLSNSAVSSPLYVVNGVAMDDISFLNPEDIKEISVLKDASSSSIYGSRAAFGVILITTKGGERTDRTSIKYSNNFGWSQATIMPETVDNVTQFSSTIEAAYPYPGCEREFFGNYATEYLEWSKKWQAANGGKRIKTYRQAQQYVDENNIGDFYINSQGKIIGYADYDLGAIMVNNAAPSQQHNVSISGSTGKAVYDLSFAYSDRQSLINFNPDKLRRYNANANLQLDLFKWLTAGVRINFTKRAFQTPNVGSNIWGTVFRFPGNYSPHGWVPDADGTPQDFRNEILYLKQADPQPIDTYYTRMQAWAKATITKGLTLNADYTFALLNQNSSYAYLPAVGWNSWNGTYSGQLSDNPLWNAVAQTSTTATKTNMSGTRWTANIYATYDFTVAEKNNFKVMLGTNIEQNRSQKFAVRTTILLDNNLPALNLYSGEIKFPSMNDLADGHWATAGFFGRINYDFANRYLLELNGRYDGSSKFPAKDQWGFFGSGSLGWRFSEEEFFKPIKDWWSNGKIRASYGEIGNEAVGDNMFIATISNSNISYIQNGILVNAGGSPSVVSPTLSWERIRTTDVGFDFGFLNNSLNVSFDWYQRDTKDMLAVGVTLPGTFGASAPYGNNGSLRTRGWELNLGWNQTFGDWYVYANFNIADAKTTITKWNNPSMTLGNYYTGAEYGAIWGLEYDRYYTVDDFVADPGQTDGIARNAQGQLITKDGVTNQWALETGNFHYMPGDVMYKDQDGDGEITGGNGTAEDHGDLKVIGNSLPRYEYGFHLGAAWKGFDLDIFCQGVGKRDLWTVSSMVIPFTQAQNDILYSHMTDHNSIIMNDNYEIIGYNVSESNMYPRLYPGQYANNNVNGLKGAGTGSFIPNSRYLQDLSYLRVKNITLGYTLPAEWTTKAYIQKARIYFSGENLFFLHRGNKNTSCFDPEITTTEWSGANTVGRANPMQRVYSFGIQVTF